MMPAMNPCRRAGAVALACVALQAHAYFDNFLSGTLVGTLNEEQVGVLVETFRATLADAADGSSVMLQLPPDKAGKVTEGTLTPVKTATVRGERCRQIRSNLRQGERKERWTGWYCQQANGEWKRTAIKQ